MEFPFLKERLERFLAIIPEGFKITDDIKKSPKGLSVAIERDLSKKPQNAKPKTQVTAPQDTAPAAETEPETLD